jgi:hypothetical protein
MGEKETPLFVVAKSACVDRKRGFINYSLTSSINRLLPCPLLRINLTNPILINSFSVSVTVWVPILRVLLKDLSSQSIVLLPWTIIVASNSA